MVGDPAPWFTASSTSSPNFHFDTVAGHRIILSFIGSSKLEGSDRLIRDFVSLQAQFEVHKTPFFGVIADPDDTELERLIDFPTYFKFFWDFDWRVSMLYRVCDFDDSSSQIKNYVPTTFVLNERLQIVGVFPIAEIKDHAQRVFGFVTSLPRFVTPVLAARQAPVLTIPNVLSKDLCRHLICRYEEHGGRPSGFMRQVDGKTVEVTDHSFKQRCDLLLEELELLQTINDLIVRRVKPEIERAFQFSITRFERHLVACYEATTKGFFRRHRDNTTRGTVHRRFAMTLNLNTGNYDGGCLWFPEFGSQLYRPDIGEAIIFSCSLLHEVTPVTQGRRFALLSFFYGDEDAKVRERNRQYVVLKDESTQNAGDRSISVKPSLGFHPKTHRKSAKSAKSSQRAK